MSDITQRAQVLVNEQIKLLSIMPRNEKHNARLEEIQKETEALHKYYNNAVDSLNDVLQPFGEKISDRIPPTWRKL